MPTPFLAINHIDGTTPQAKTYAGTTVTTHGVAFGSLPGNGNTAEPQNKNGIIVFGGDNNTWIALSAASIYRTTDAGANWAVVQALTVPSTDTMSLNTGFHVVDIGGVPTIVFAYLTTTLTQMRAYKSTDGVTWTAMGPYTIASRPPSCSFRDVIAFHSTIAFATVRSGSTPCTIYMWDVATDAMTTFTAENSGVNVSNYMPCCFVVWKDTLCFISRFQAGASNQEWYLYDITSGTQERIATILTGGSGTTTGGALPAAFEDPATGDLIIFRPYAPSGDHVHRVNKTTLAVTQIQAQVLPAAWAEHGNGRVLVYVDQEANPGGDPDIYLYHRGNVFGAGSPMTCWKWNGVAANVTLVDSGGNQAHTLSIPNRSGGGPCTWVADELRLRVVSWTGTGIINGIRVSFKLYSMSGSQACSVRGWNRARTEAHTKNPSKLMTPSHGSLSGAAAGNLMEGLTADNGVTTYEVTIDLEDQNRPNFERSAQVLDVVAV
jgi:hypothetical protein